MPERPHAKSRLDRMPTAGIPDTLPEIQTVQRYTRPPNPRPIALHESRPEARSRPFLPARRLLDDECS
jgi:hypothetical protein